MIDPKTGFSYVIGGEVPPKGMIVPPLEAPMTMDELKGVPPMYLNSKETNPKDIVGSTKPVVSTISRIVLREVREILGYLPTPIVWQVGLGMEEGARKYGRHNYRVAGVRASIYYDATYRHIDKWGMGEDIDPDSNLNHIVKAICSLTVLVDAIYNDKLNDDRPPAVKYAWPSVALFDASKITASRELTRIQDFLDMWWEGGSTKMLLNALAALFRLAAIIDNEELEDDRVFGSTLWMQPLQEHMDGLIKLYPTSKPPYTNKEHGQ